jgi:O-antigen/teichoic acid export membrane protein
MLKKISINKKFFFSISAYVWSAVIPALITIIINPIIANNLTAKDYAIIGYYTSFNLIVLPFVTFSFINYYSRNFFLKTEEERIRLKDTLITSSLTLGPILTTICIILFLLFTEWNKISLPIFPYVLLSFFTNLFNYYFLFYQTELKMKGDVKKYFSISIANSIVVTILTIVFVVLIKGQAEGKFFSLLLANVIVAVYCIKKMITRFRVDRNMLKECIRFSWPIILSSILFYVFGSIDRVFLEKLNNVDELGLYNIAYQIVGYVAIISIAVLQTFTPDIYKFAAQKDYKKLLKIALLVFIPSVIINLSFIPFSKIIISILTFNKFTEAYHLADILIFRNICYIAFFVFSDILIGLGLSKFDLLTKGLGTIFAVGIYYWAIQKFGFIGAAWSQSIALIIPVFLGMGMLLCFKKRIL